MTETYVEQCAHGTDVRRMTKVMNSFQSGHGMSSHTSWREHRRIIAISKKGPSNYFGGKSLEYNGDQQW